MTIYWNNVHKSIDLAQECTAKCVEMSLNVFNLGVCKLLASTIDLDIAMNVHNLNEISVQYVCSMQNIKSECGVFYTRKGIWQSGI